MRQRTLSIGISRRLYWFLVSPMTVSDMFFDDENADDTNITQERDSNPSTSVAFNLLPIFAISVIIVVSRKKRQL